MSKNTQNPPAVIIQDVNFQVGEQKILENITFSIPQGQYVGIIGPNGGGKTTLLKIILGLTKATSGRVTIMGKSSQHPEVKRRIGYVPQKASQADAQFPATVEEVVRSGRTPKLGLFRYFKAKDRSAVKKALEISGIYHLRQRLMSKLSGGERQKVFIARALAAEPDILILDEPTIAIDVASQGQFYQFLGGLNKTQKLTVIIVSHDIDVVAKEVSSVVCLNRGLVCHGTPAEFIKDEYLEKLYGKKVKFILHGH